MIVFSTSFAHNLELPVETSTSSHPGPPQPAFIVPATPVVHYPSSITQCTSHSPQPAEKAQLNARAISNVNTPELMSALNTLRSFLFPMALQHPLPPLPPQIIVKGNGKKRAYGRMGLKAMSYEEATSIFIEKFAEEHDWLFFPERNARYPPNVTLYATFVHNYPDGAEQGSAVVDEHGWTELVENMEKIRIVFTKMIIPGKPSNAMPISF